MFQVQHLIYFEVSAEVSSPDPCGPTVLHVLDVSLRQHTCLKLKRGRI